MRYILLTCLLICLASMSESLFSQAKIEVMSFNIRFGTADDGPNHWDIRKDKVASLMQYYETDFIGIQEMMGFQKAFLLEKLPNYQAIGVSRTGDDEDEGAIMFYNKTKYQKIKEETFWLSTTPKLVNSKSWDAAYPRVATYGLFRNKKTKKSFWVINTHFDHIGITARLESAKMINQLALKLQKEKDCPIIFMGDLNAEETELSIQSLEKDWTNCAKDCKIPNYGPKGTWNAFDFQTIPDMFIDYVFIKNPGIWKTHKFRVIDDFYEFKYPSDHLPILATLVAGYK